MTRRIVSGVFLLIALGVLGVIIAGALTSGEQLVVRFLTAIIVAALALYMVSDLRLQANDDAVVAGIRATTPSPRITISDAPPPNSTAAFMATVTGKRSTDATKPISAKEFSHSETPNQAVAGEEKMATVGGESRSVTSTAAADNTTTATIESSADSAHSPYEEDLDEAAMWPFNDTSAAIGSDELAALDDVDGLVAMFTKQTEQELSNKALSLAGGGTGSVATSEAPARPGRQPEGGGTNLGNNPGPTPVSPPAPLRVLPTPGGPGSNPRSEPSTTPPSESEEDFAFGQGERVAQASAVNNGKLTTKGDGATTEMGKATEAAKATESNDADASSDIDLPMAKEADRSKGGTSSVNLPVVPTQGASVTATDYANRGIAPIIDLRSAPSIGGIATAIHSGEIEVIASLIEQGLLTTEGPITDRDVRTMVYVAFTSSELRKILHTGGKIEGDNSDFVLGDGDVFARLPEGDTPARRPAIPVAFPTPATHELPSSRAL